MRYDNNQIFEKYQNVMLNESTKGMRRKCQVLEDKIDDFMDQLEKEIDKIDDNPTFQRSMYQMLSNTTKEYNEYLAILKQVCQTLDSGAKVMPSELPAVGEKMEAADNVTDEKAVDEEGNEIEEEEPETGDQEEEFELKVAKKGAGKNKKKAKKDKEKFPEILCANDNGEPFYTNSTQLRVNLTDDIFEVLDLQDEIQTKYTGGTVIHLFLGEHIEDGNVVKNMVRKICENYHLPYFTFTPTFSVCPNHGYLPGELARCPRCNTECEIYSRIVGYLRPVSQWNRGKKEEFRLRKTFKV